MTISSIKLLGVSFNILDFYIIGNQGVNMEIIQFPIQGKSELASSRSRSKIQNIPQSS